MMIKTVTIAVGLMLALFGGTAFAQSDSSYPTPSQQMIGGSPKHGGQGKRAQIKADVQAGRISKSEGKQLKQQLKAQRTVRRAQKQARRTQGYQPANYASPPQ